MEKDIDRIKQRIDWLKSQIRQINHRMPRLMIPELTPPSARGHAFKMEQELESYRSELFKREYELRRLERRENPHAWTNLEIAAVTVGGAAFLGGLAYFIFRPKAASAASVNIPVVTGSEGKIQPLPFKLRWGQTYYVSAPYVNGNIVTNPPMTDEQLQMLWRGGSEWIPGTATKDLLPMPPGAPPAWMTEWNAQDRALFTATYMGPDNADPDLVWHFFGLAPRDPRLWDLYAADSQKKIPARADDTISITLPFVQGSGQLWSPSFSGDDGVLRQIRVQNNSDNTMTVTFQVMKPGQTKLMLTVMGAHGEIVQPTVEFVLNVVAMAPQS